MKPPAHHYKGKETEQSELVAQTKARGRGRARAPQPTTRGGTREAPFGRKRELFATVRAFASFSFFHSKSARNGWVYYDPSH